jgi:hypothetical protein
MTLVELVIGKFPFPPNGQPLSVFELLEYIVNEPVPTLPVGNYSKEFEAFIAEWYVSHYMDFINAILNISMGILLMVV